MSIKNWKEQFQEELRSISSSYSKETANGNLLSYALKHQAIPEEVYYSWAHENYRVPFVKSQFFTSPKFQKKVWDKWKSQFEWHQTFLPLGEWDGHIIIGCLDPSERAPELPAIYLLCRLEDLELAWTNYGGTTQSKDSLQSIATAPPPANQRIVAQLTPQAEEPKSKQPELELNDAPAKVAIKTPSLESRKIASNDLKKSEEKILTENISTAPDKEKRTYFLEVLHKDKQQQFLSQAKNTFDSMHAFFTKSFILAVDNQGQACKPVAWDENFSSAQCETINLASPSMFRIVNTTSKPYHGSVTLNEANEKFFNEWNKKEIPAHVTIVPLISNQKVIGMLVGFGDSTANNKAILNNVEKIGQQFLTALIPAINTAA